jgi:hypothetical protein
MPFRVFLSHARGDEAIARWLQGQLNSFHTPRPLIGTQGAHGPIPAKLKATLGGLADLADYERFDDDEGQALIVVCSANAAQDATVNRDVDAFVALGRARQIVPVIAANAPESLDVERDYYPPAVAGRGLFSVDLRQRKVGDAWMGDGKEGGRLKLISALLGIDIATAAEHERRKHNARFAALALVALVCALGATAALSFGLHAQRRAEAVNTERQNAARNAMRAFQLQRQALAAVEEQSAQQTQANAQLQRARQTLSAAVRDVNTLSDVLLNQAAENHAASPTAIRALASLERTYWDLGEVAPFFELRATAITAPIEKIASTYAAIGRADDAQRVTDRFSRLNEHISRNRTASPVWRNAYAAAIAALADTRAASGDAAGQDSALQQAGRIYNDVCVAPLGASNPSQAFIDARAGACLRFGYAVLARANVQRQTRAPIDLPALDHARSVLDAAIAAYPNNAQLQSRGVRVRDQLKRLFDAGTEAAAQQTND